MWKFELINLMKDPKYLLYSDDKVAVIIDGFPKAKHHFLVLPKENISNLMSVRETHLELLKHMEQKGRDTAEEHGKGRPFKFGYHAQPSMERLHLHVISTDFVSNSLKHKKHWNSFTTPFFLESEDVIYDLETKGKITIPTRSAIENFLKTPLKCHMCDYLPKNFPHLKKHLLSHLEDE